MMESRKRRRVTRKWRRRKSQHPLHRCVMWGRVCRTAQYPGTEPGSCSLSSLWAVCALFSVVGVIALIVWLADLYQRWWVFLFCSKVACMLTVNRLHNYVRCRNSSCVAPTFSFEGIKNFLTWLLTWLVIWTPLISLCFTGHRTWSWRRKRYKCCFKSSKKNWGGGGGGVTGAAQSARFSPCLCSFIVFSASSPKQPAPYQPSHSLLTTTPLPPLTPSRFLFSGHHCTSVLSCTLPLPPPPPPPTTQPLSLGV